MGHGRPGPGQVDGPVPVWIHTIVAYGGTARLWVRTQAVLNAKGDTRRELSACRLDRTRPPSPLGV